MSTEAAIVTSDPAPLPGAFEPVASETKTPDEIAYFKSRGETFKAPEAKPTVTEAKAPAAKVVEPTADPVDDGEIEVEDGGTIRDKKTGRYVPKSAFLRVKGDLQTKSTEAQQLRDQLIQTRERLSVLTEVLPPAEAKQEQAKTAAEMPDPQTDVFGALEWAKTRIAELEGKVTKTADETQRDRERANLQNFFTSDVAKFTQTNADFLDALQHGIGIRHKMLEAVGMKDEAQRQRAVLSEINDLIKETAAERKTNPNASVAAKLYDAAKALGYAKKAAEPSKDQNADALAEISRLNTAQAASQTLGKGGSSAVGENLTREKYAGMGDAESSSVRANYIAKHGRSAWNDFIAGRR